MTLSSPPRSAITSLRIRRPKCPDSWSADDTVVLPGHGPTTTIAAERATNPYLREAAGAAAPSKGW